MQGLSAAAECAVTFSRRIVFHALSVFVGWLFVCNRQIMCVCVPDPYFISKTTVQFSFKFGIVWSALEVGTTI
jgi:hypothetical protein